MDRNFDSRQRGVSFRGHSNGIVRTAPDRKLDSNGSLLGKYCSLFSGTPPSECARISAAAHAKDFKRGEMFFIEGDPVQQIALLTAGFVKITQLGIRGTEVILRLSVPGDVLGAVALFSTARHCTTAQAFRPCQALVWDARLFKTMTERLPVLHSNMICLMSQYLEELEQRFREVATEKVPQRVARQLVRLAETIGRNAEGDIEIGLSREELAQMTGTTLFTVSRLLSAWESYGFVRPRREAVVISDVDSMASIADSLNPSELFEA